MKELEWNNKQKELFNLYFSNNEDSAISMENINDKINEYVEKWDILKNIIVNHIKDFKFHESISDIRIIDHDNNRYLIIKFMITDYLIIDLKDLSIINNSTQPFPFSCEFFSKHFNDYFLTELNKDSQEISSIQEAFYFRNITKEGLKLLADFAIENENLINREKSFSYILKDPTDSAFCTYLDISLMSSGVTLFMGNTSQTGYVNYIFLNRDLKPTGVSNPTGNIEELKIMGDKVKDICVPERLIPSFLLDDIKKEKISKVLDKKR